ncbi:hypothetical protein [Streptomyces sp. NBC_01506]|uniref:hypothetical protein n=1 Tax=Streptomyces sp. NBC_01506 TaxID=2903887 RepID=UPI0038641480
MTAPRTPTAPPDPADPNYYNRGPRWPGETLRPLALTPDEMVALRRGLAVVAALAWGDPS